MSSKTDCIVDAQYRGEWRKAFIACRKHRIDLAVLVGDVDHFIGAIAAFVTQLDDPEYLNLFLTTIS
jgi:elongator complex protein 1